MSYGTSDNNTNMLFFSIKAKKDGKQVPPFFQVTKPTGDGKYVVDGECTFVQGDLVKVQFKDREWNGDIIRTFSVFLRDGEDMYKVDLGFTLLGRSIMNSLLNLEDYSNVKISLWMGKNGYAQGGVRQNDEIVRWKFELNEIPQPEETTFKGKVMRDYTEVDAFFTDALKEKFADLEKKPNAASSPKPDSEVEPESSDEDEEDYGDDVPF